MHPDTNTPSPNPASEPTVDYPLPIRDRLARKPITAKELQILQMLGLGLRNKEISIRAAISHNTVKVHLRRIFQKLGVSNRADAKIVAIQRGLIS